MQLLTDYVVGKFFRELLPFSAFVTLLIFAIQALGISYLFFSLPWKEVITYTILWLIYAFFLSVALSTPLVLGNIILTLKEERVFHILNTFGFSEWVVFRRLFLGMLVLTTVGIFASFFVNYQKISYITKYLKFQFKERILLSVPRESFFQGESFSFYFDNREGNRFEHIVIKTPQEVASALEGELTPDGLLVLRKFSLFSGRDKTFIFAKGDKYELSLTGSYHYTLPTKKLVENLAFMVTLFLTPLLFLPLMFYIFLKRTETRFKTYLTALGMVILQFAIASLVKALVGGLPLFK